MKLTKKLIPALGMLVLSACMLVTSTFAWFSMNTTVTATNMTVTAKGDQVYLQIVNEDTPFEPGASQTSAQAKTATGNLLPTNVYKEFSATNPVAYDGGKDIVWVSAVGKKPSAEYQEGDETKNDGYEPVGNYENVTSTADGNYVLKNTFKIRLDPTAGAANSSAPLKVSAVTVTGTSDKTFSQCLSILVVCTYDGNLEDAEPAQTQGDLWNYQDVTYKHATGTSKTLTTGNLTKNTEATVVVYVFFNGDNEHCTLEELAAAASESYGVEVTFTCV